MSTDPTRSPLSPVALLATLEPLERAKPLPGAAFTDPEVFRFEKRALFDRSWICVGRVEDVPSPGDVVVVPATPEGVLVARGDDGQLRAFYNVCRHRAATLLPRGGPACTRAKELECPYHGWAYDTAGRLLRAPDAPASFDAKQNGLVPIRLATRFGFVFIHLDGDGDGPLPEAPPAFLTRAAAALEGGALRRVRAHAYDVAANWKLVFENFQESHHFPRVHPALERLTPSADAGSILSDGPWLAGVMELVPDAETVSTSGNRNGRPYLVAEADRRKVHDAILFPSLMLSLQPDYLLTFHVYPVAPDRTHVIACTYMHEGAPEAAAADVLGFWSRIYEEDRAICERQQSGVVSRAFEPACYATVEDGVHAFDKLVARGHLDGGPPVEAERDEPTDPGLVVQELRSEPRLRARDDARSEPRQRVAGPRGKRSRLCGIWGRPYLDLSEIVDTSVFPELHKEITLGLARVDTSYTGGSLKWMGVTAPWTAADGYTDYMHVIGQMTREQLLELVSLSDDPSAFDVDELESYEFGDETEHPLNLTQMRFLSYRYGVYFPWKVAYHLLENVTWDDKHSGEGKAFSDEARAVFPKTVAFIESLPMSEMGRVVIFGLEPNDHAPAHRDSTPGQSLSVAQSLNLEPGRGLVDASGRPLDKRFFLASPDGQEEVVVDSPIYWFNDMDYHGVHADPFFRYSIRVDGVFTPELMAELRDRFEGA